LKHNNFYLLILNFFKLYIKRNSLVKNSIKIEDEESNVSFDEEGSFANSSESSQGVIELEWDHVPDNKVDKITKYDDDKIEADEDKFDVINEKDNKPYLYFSKLVDDNFYNYIIDQSRIFVKEKMEKKCISEESVKKIQNRITVDMLKKTISVQLLMGIIKLPRIRFYWSRLQRFQNSIFPKIMSYNDYNHISKYLHFNNNAHCTNLQDKLFKISPVISYLNKKWSEHTPPNHKEEFCIDETMLGFRGRLGIRQYVPSKPVKYGIKIYALASSMNGYIKRWIVYTGKKYNGHSPAEVVQEFSDHVPEKAHFYFDGLFSNINVFTFLNQKNIFYTASVRKNRKGFPKTPKKKDIEKHQTIYFKHEKMTYVQFRDNKIMGVVSNFYGPTNITVLSKKNELIDRPLMIYKYNQAARGVDKNNQISSFYFSNRRTIKWYKKLFYYSIEVSISNAYVMYLADKNKKMNLLDFHLAVVDGLSGVKMIEEEHTKPPQHRLHGKHFLRKLPNNLQRDCKVCSNRSIKRITTNFQCEVCRKSMCPTTCFKKYHTLMNYKENNTSTNEKSLPGLDLKENLAGLDLKENLPSLDLKENLPSLDLKENLPLLDLNENIPELGLKENIPGLDLKENIPGLDLKENLPEIDLNENLHEIDLNENLPDIDLNEQIISYSSCLNGLTDYWGLGIGDWGLGIGDWAQSPIPNPQSPIPEKFIFLNIFFIFLI